MAMLNNMKDRLLEKSDALITCPVCYEDYSSVHPPITLPCGHTFCRVCIRKLKNGKAFVRCPIDKTRKKLMRPSVNTDYLSLVESIRNGNFEVKNQESIGVQMNHTKDIVKLQQEISKVEKDIKNSEEYNQFLIDSIQFTLGKLYSRPFN